MHAPFFWDTVIYSYLVKKVHDSIDSGESYISDLNKWFNVNKLCLNIDKTCYSVFGVRDCNKTSVKFKLNGLQLQQVESTIYLGIIIDSHLTWEKTYWYPLQKNYKVY